MNSSQSLRCGVILLAAGGSRRMGQPKQLLPVQGRPLVRHVAEIVTRAVVSPVAVVLGAEAAQVEPTLAGLPVRCVVNPDWAEGMASSLRAGVAALRAEAPDLAAIVVVLADQPGLSAEHLEKLLQVQAKTGATIVASQVGEARVPPVLFGARWFSALAALTGDAGARDLLRAHRDETVVVPLADNIDLDTPEDYARYVRDRGDSQR